MSVSRRRFLRSCVAMGVLATGAGVSPRAAMGAPRRRLRHLQLQEQAGELGVHVPEGFSVRVVAQAGREPVPGCGYDWHTYPDGGAVFAQANGGWIYVSNSEMPCLSTKKSVMRANGGVGALRFNAAGDVTDAYPILEGSIRNCAGGATPWGTWLSCEEYRNGQVWECDPTGKLPAKPLPALGIFTHEAAAVDDVRGHVYLSEDEYHGYLYRFRPRAYPDLSEGKLEAALLQETGTPGAWSLDWVEIPDPQGGADNPCREQVEATTFLGGEGLWYHENTIYLATKHDGRVWSVDLVRQLVTLVYDKNAEPAEYVDDIDNLLVAPDGSVLIAEERHDMRLLAVNADGSMYPLVRVAGQEQSEIAGQAFSPDGTRLYFSSQRGPGRGMPGVPLSPPYFKKFSTCVPLPQNAGITYEVRGQFFE